MTIPGIATLEGLNCLSTGANVELDDSKVGTTGLWTGGDTGFAGTNWSAAMSTFAATAGTTWHLGKGSGRSAVVVAVTVSTEATGGNCIYQATAQMTRGS